ncbi:MAG: 3-isopropylmalate dehydratase small subunit [Candidatus Thorarchaeota archaeon]|nr:3-isopropylmalate dehydratase small subunit [Candidatus Thorarchaeota archaeon]
MNRSSERITGRAWKFGNNIDTDQIIQGRYLTLLDYKEMAKHAFEIPRPEFASSVKSNDIVVAGRNFGTGSSREEAPQVLLELGVGCILAESFARIFYRNAFNVGLPAMIIPDAAKEIPDMSTIHVNLLKGTVEVEGTDAILNGKSIPEFMREILDAGGAVSWYRNRMLS